MNRNENNKRLAAWLGVPCWHEQDIWHCKKCNANLYEVEKATGQVNPDYYTNDGFFALLDGLKAKELHVIIDCDIRVKDKSEVAIYDDCVLVAWLFDADLPTALVEAAIQAMEASDGQR